MVVSVRFDDGDFDEKRSARRERSQNEIAGNHADSVDDRGANMYCFMSVEYRSVQLLVLILS